MTAPTTIGMSRTTGKAISEDEHINQSVQDILITPIGSRIKRREYGSHLFALIDSAGNEAGKLRLLAAAVDALNHWEPRITLTDANLTVERTGKTTLSYTFIKNNTPNNSIKHLLNQSVNLPLI